MANTFSSGESVYVNWTAPSILVVTEDEQLLRLSHLMVAGDGRQLTSTQDFGHGLKKVLDALNPSLVIVDIVMPTMIGIKTALQVRLWTSAVTLLLTTWETRGNGLRQLDLNSANGLTMPMSLEEVSQRINEIISRVEGLD